ncbi:hypothetical protein JB92DRAFT_2911169, partial [Gautieria morchelliformis]
ISMYIVFDDPQAKRGKRDKTIDLKPLMARETIQHKHAKGKARASGQGPSFKLPSLPGEAHGEDVFGISSSSVCSRTLDSDDLEISNKMIVRKSTVEALAARGMPKEHPEFKELFGWVISGVGFSLVCCNTLCLETSLDSSPIETKDERCKSG